MSTLPAEARRISPAPEPALLSVDGLQVEFVGDYGWTRVVDDGHLSMRRGDTRALVGESGSGKTITALSVMGLVPHPQGRVTAGTIMFEGRDLRSMPRRQMRELRGRDIAMIFQEPMTSLNPAYTVGDQIAETVRRHRGLSRKDAWARAVEMLDLVGIPAAARRAKEYPHAFSGGMRQRVMIAMAISCDPKLLIADEPTTALDVTVQAAILELLRSLRDDIGMAVLLVTHDLGVVADFCDDVTVMYAGQVIEDSPSEAIFSRPLHPYTAGLLSAMPQSSLLGQALVVIPGVVPRPEHMPPGCRFHPRCPHAVSGTCDVGTLDLLEVEPARDTRCVRVQKRELSDTASGFQAYPTAVPLRSTGAVDHAGGTR
jgi:oligopeptide/dipeptide ABC transporter ATP-binding protein